MHGGKVKQRAAASNIKEEIEIVEHPIEDFNYPTDESDVQAMKDANEENYPTEAESMEHVNYHNEIFTLLLFLGKQAKNP